MYWEQLELRCRSLYSGAPMPPPTGPAVIGALGTPRGGPCRCCEQCHAHRTASAYPWDGDNRFWAPGQLGNLYSPNPGGDEGNRMNNSGQRNRSGGWNWPRMPWQRSDNNQQSQQTTQQNTQQTPQNRCRPTPTSPDSQYGFANGSSADPNAVPSQQGGYSVIGNPYGIWGPPPPYSDPNSPARRGRYQYIHPSQCHQPMIEQLIPPQNNLSVLECHQHQHQSSTDSHSSEQFCPQQTAQVSLQQQALQRNAIKRQAQFKTKDNYENTPSDSDGGSRDRFSNTLPVRKIKKRVDGANKSIGPNQPAPRTNVQNVFDGSPNHTPEDQENEYNEPTNPAEPSQVANSTPQHAKNRRIKLGVENTGFQPIESVEREAANGKLAEPAESEVYFADVSSCCNISVKNDNFYEDANRRNKKENLEQDDYLSQRFGKREPSVRSRLPFPQMIPEDFDKSAATPSTVKQINVVPAPRTSLIHKDISRQSMLSIDSGEKTDFTDLSPATPSANFLPIYSLQQQQQIDAYHQQESFVASFPYNEQQSQEAHRRSTKNLHDILLADAQYETIKDSNQYETTPLTLNYEHHHELSSSSTSSGSYNKSSTSLHYHQSPVANIKAPMSLNLTPIKRQNNLGTNISAIIQNLSGSEVMLNSAASNLPTNLESS